MHDFSANGIVTLAFGTERLKIAQLRTHFAAKILTCLSRVKTGGLMTNFSKLVLIIAIISGALVTTNIGTNNSKNEKIFLVQTGGGCIRTNSCMKITLHVSGEFTSEIGEAGRRVTLDWETGRSAMGPVSYTGKVEKDLFKRWSSMLENEDLDLFLAELPLGTGVSAAPYDGIDLAYSLKVGGEMYGLSSIQNEIDFNTPFLQITSELHRHMVDKTFKLGIGARE